MAIMGESGLAFPLFHSSLPSCPNRLPTQPSVHSEHLPRGCLGEERHCTPVCPQRTSPGCQAPCAGGPTIRPTLAATPLGYHPREIPFDSLFFRSGEKLLQQFPRIRSVHGKQALSPLHPAPTGGPHRREVTLGPSTQGLGQHLLSKMKTRVED